MFRSRLALMPMSFAALALLGAAAFADTGIKTGDSALGPVLTDAMGMSLYTFDKDSGDVSACYDKCAVNWPPLIAPAGAMAEDDFGLITRTDGTLQWTYYGKPLYLWIKDSVPGEVTGDGVNDVWHVAKPTK
jgi:predicted lipoprotein with Yx(FWY)xxD motif